MKSSREMPTSDFTSLPKPGFLLLPEEERTHPGEGLALKLTGGGTGLDLFGDT